MIVKGMAVSRSGKYIAVIAVLDYLWVLSASDGSVVCRMGRSGWYDTSLNMPMQVCFTKTDNMLVAEFSRKRVHELTLQGSHVRYIGQGVIGRCLSVATNDEVIAAGMLCLANADGNSTAPAPVLLFDSASGAFVRSVGLESPRGGPARSCVEVRFTSDGRELVVLARAKGSCWLSVLTAAGEAVRGSEQEVCIGAQGFVLLRDDRAVVFGSEIRDGSDCVFRVMMCGVGVGRESVVDRDVLVVEGREWWRGPGKVLAEHGGELYVVDLATRCLYVVA